MNPRIVYPDIFKKNHADNYLQAAIDTGWSAWAAAR